MRSANMHPLAAAVIGAAVAITPVDAGARSTSSRVTGSVGKTLGSGWFEKSPAPAPSRSMPAPVVPAPRTAPAAPSHSYGSSVPSQALPTVPARPSYGATTIAPRMKTSPSWTNVPTYGRSRVADILGDVAGSLVVNGAMLAAIDPAYVEKMGAQAYDGMVSDARAKGRLVPRSDPRYQQVSAVFDRIISAVKNDPEYGAKARGFSWELVVIDQPVVNAACFPGGKVVVWTGFLDKLSPTGNELALVGGHEVGHAVEEHGYERMRQSLLTAMAVDVAGSVATGGNRGLGTIAVGQVLKAYFGGQYSQANETEADGIGFDFAKSAGYDVGQGANIFRKIAALQWGGQDGILQWFSSHPASMGRAQRLEERARVEGPTK